MQELVLQCEIWLFSSQTHKPQVTAILPTQPPPNQNPRKHQHNLPWTKPLCFILCINCCVLCLIVVCLCVPLAHCWQCPCHVACAVLFAHAPLSHWSRRALPPVACCSQCLVLRTPPCQMLSVWLEETILVSTRDAGVNAAAVNQAEVDHEILDEEEEMWMC